VFFWSRTRLFVLEFCLLLDWCFLLLVHFEKNLRPFAGTRTLQVPCLSIYFALGHAKHAKSFECGGHLLTREMAYLFKYPENKIVKIWHFTIQLQRWWNKIALQWQNNCSRRLHNIALGCFIKIVRKTKDRFFSNSGEVTNPDQIAIVNYQNHYVWFLAWTQTACEDIALPETLKQNHFFGMWKGIHFLLQ